MLHASEFTPKILIIDSHGQPVRWALMQRAARYYAAGKVLTELGDNIFGMAVLQATSAPAATLALPQTGSVSLGIGNWSDLGSSVTGALPALMRS